MPILEVEHPPKQGCIVDIARRIGERQLPALYTIHIVLNEYEPIIAWPEGLKHSYAVCLIGVDSNNIEEAFRRASLEFYNNARVGELEDALEAGDFKRARRILDDVEDVLVGMGLGDYVKAFRALNDRAITVLKTGSLDRAIEYAGEAARILGRMEFEYIIRRLSESLMILHTGGYAIILQKPPRSGLYYIRVEWPSIILDLARLFPGNIRALKEPGDVDAAFLEALMRVRPSYRPHILKAYLEANGVKSREAFEYALKDFTLAPSVVKSIRNGYLTFVIILDDVYIIELPRARIRTSGDLDRDFISLIRGP